MELSEAIELFLAESDKAAPPDPLEVLLSQLMAELQSLDHGLGVVQQKIDYLAELPGHWKDIEKERANGHQSNEKSG